MDVAEVALNRPDAAGSPVEEVYARNPPFYAVYRTKDRVTVHYADAGVMAGGMEEQAKQRADLAPLNPLRGEIAGLIDGWRGSERVKLKSKARYFDRRVADALIVALQGDLPSASSLLQAIKDDAKDERISWARFQYLLVASAAVLVVVSLIGFFTSEWFGKSVHAFPADTKSIWLASAVGAVGAFFSIATGIRGRTVLPDLRMRDNAADGVLRIVIGVIAAVVLVCLVQSKIVGLKIGEVEVAASTATLVALIAFTAGFLERLVPDLLAKSVVAAPAEPAAQAVRPAVNPQLQPSPAVMPPVTSAEVHDHDVDDISDACLCDPDKAIDPDDATGDAELPVAVGGVAAAPRA